MSALIQARRALRPRTRWMHAKERIDGRYAVLARPGRPSVSRRVLVTGVYREGEMIGRAVSELQRSRHRTTFRLGAMAEAAPDLRDITVAEYQSKGKFQNINGLIASSAPFDWLLIIDDDVELAVGFLDTFIATCEHYGFALAQPAQTRTSNANWPVAKRKFLSVARSTRFVEIGPVTAISAKAAQLLLPFPEDLRYGWGLDFHWAYLAESNEVGMGVVDIAAVNHATRKVASTYSWDVAQEEGRRFLAQRSHLPSSVALRSVRTFRRMPVLWRRPGAPA